MRFVERPADSEPACLSDPVEAIRDERKAAARHYFRADPAHEGFASYKFKEYRRAEVKQALHRIFGGKCAYCERDIRAGADGEIEHYRPKGGVEGEVHPGYWWLAHSWLNMLPSCKACNQGRLVIVLEDVVDPAEFERLRNRRARTSHGKRNQFPIAGVRAMHRKDDHDAEHPLLIDPTVTDPDDHLVWEDGHQSVVRPRMVDGVPDPRGLASIRAYALNRVPLVSRRTSDLQVLRLQRTRIMEQLEESLAAGEDRVRAIERARRDAEWMRRGCGDDREFTAMLRAFMDDFDRELAGMAADPAA